MEKFLEFWSRYNATIIEALVALILISVIYLAYRMFFGPKGPDAFDSAGAGGASVDTTHIEKTLQKILEQQTAAKASTSSSAGSGTAASAEIMHEVSHLKKTLEEKEKQIGQLKSQVEVAEKQAAASAAAAAGGNAVPVAAAAPANTGLAEKERQDYEAKIKELEAKLSEYEIISEDIADVSFFKEENARLNAEIAALKAGAGSAPAAVAAAVTPPAAAAAPEPVVAAASTEMSQEAIDAALLAELASQSGESAAPAAAASAGPEASSEAMNAIDDSLMAEFARAVEGQKEGTLQEPPKSDEEAKLLEEFENFSKKG